MHSHRPPVSTTSLASSSRAAPLSIASAAVAAQVAGEAAFSAVQSAAAALAITMSRAGPGWLARTARITAALSSRQKPGCFPNASHRDRSPPASSGSDAPLPRPARECPAFLPLSLSCLARARFRHLRRPGERHFVQPVAAVDHNAPLGAQHDEGLGQERTQFGPADAQQLSRSACRIDQRADDVEDCGHPQLRADRGDVPHRAVQQRGEAET